MQKYNFNQACQRPDGSIYGIEDGLTCRKGTQITLNAETIKRAYKKAFASGAKAKDLKKITEKVKKDFSGLNSSDAKVALINELNSFKPKTLKTRLQQVKDFLNNRVLSRKKIFSDLKEAEERAAAWGITEDEKIVLFSKAMKKYPAKEKFTATMAARKEAARMYDEYAKRAKNKSDKEILEILDSLNQKGVRAAEIERISADVKSKYNTLNNKEARNYFISQLKTLAVPRPKADANVTGYIKEARERGVTSNQIKEAVNSLKGKYNNFRSKEAKVALINKVNALEPEIKGGFPSTLENLEFVRKLGGSTGAELVKDPKTGKLYVRKTGSSPEHIREEFYAEEVYRSLGVDVPESQLYENNGNPVKLSEYLPNARPLGSLTGKEREEAINKIKEGFAVDALLGNWDSIGMDEDNILVDENGKPWRVDVGGSLRFRAQGASKKGDQWNEYPTELWSMRESSQGKEIYGDLTIGEISDQIRNLNLPKIQRAIESLPKPLKETIQARFTEARRISDIQNTFSKDDFKEEYIEEFTRNSMGLRNAGIVDKLSRRFDPDPDEPFTLNDEKGQEFDQLRGPNSLVREVDEFVKQLGGDPEILKIFAYSQGDDSWGQNAVALKYWFANQQNVPLDSFVWYDPLEAKAGQIGLDYAAKQFNEFLSKGFSEDQIKKTFTAYHAFTYEQLQRYNMPNNNREGGTIGMIRTVKSRFIPKDAQDGETFLMKQGALDSFSMFSTTYVAGDTVTVQEIPHHRVFGIYLNSRPGYNNYKGGQYLSDGENEALVMQRGIPLKVIGDVGDIPAETAIDVFSQLK